MTAGRGMRGALAAEKSEKRMAKRRRRVMAASINNQRKLASNVK